MNSKAKGNRGERELANLLKSQGHENAKRGQQYCGIGQADVVGIEGIHIECKRQQQVSDEKWLQQSERDAKPNEIPVVIYRRNHEKWKILIRQDIADLIWQTLTDEQKKVIFHRLNTSSL